MVVKFDDGFISGVMKATEVEDETSGANGLEAGLTQHSRCLAPWEGSGLHPATILCMSGET